MWECRMEGKISLIWGQFSNFWGLRLHHLLLHLSHERDIRLKWFSPIVPPIKNASIVVIPGQFLSLFVNATWVSSNSILATIHRDFEMRLKNNKKTSTETWRRIFPSPNRENAHLLPTTLENPRFSCAFIFERKQTAFVTWGWEGTVVWQS